MNGMKEHYCELYADGLAIFYNTVESRYLELAYLE